MNKSDIISLIADILDIIDFITFLFSKPTIQETHIYNNYEIIYITNEFYHEDTDSFVFLIKRIKDDIDGKIESIDYTRYLIHDDGLGLI